MHFEIFLERERFLYLLKSNYMPKQLAVFFLFICLFYSFTAYTQTGAVRGFVYLEDTGEPAIFVNIMLKGTTYGTFTDENGYFNISKIPLGSYTLISTAIGYDTASARITFTKASQIIDKKLYINESSVKLDEVVISAERQEMQTTVRMSVAKLTPKEIKKMPSLGGEPDLAQYLQVIPGVVFTGDQGGQLYIRGGSPIQNKVILDGMTVYNPFHSIGLFSTFDTDIIRTADVYTGGFGAEYGGRISSIIDIKTKEGNKNRYGGKVSANTFGSNLMLEGPLQRPKVRGGGSKSFLFSGKTSYLDQTSKSIYQYADSSGLPYSFTDLYGKITLSGSNGSKVNFFGFSFKDAVNYPDIASFEWSQIGGGANFVLIPSQSNTLIDGTIAYSKYETSSDENEETAAVKDRYSMINGFTLNMNFTNFLGENESKFGFEINGGRTEFSFSNIVDQKIEYILNTTEIAGYGQYKFKIGNLVAEPSFRLHYYATLFAFSPEPRLGLKYNVSDRFRLKGAGGLYSQNLLSATSDRDVVNLFYGFLSGPNNIQKEFIDASGKSRTVKNALQKGQHAILGFEWDLTRGLHLNVEGYYKAFNQLININRNKLFDDKPENRDVPDVEKKEFIVESGDAYGVDISLKYDYKQLSLWAVYSLGKVNRWDGIQSYNPLFDRLHNINLVGSYIFGKDLSWTIDARWNLGSGFPFTQQTGFYEKLTLQGGIDQDYKITNGELGIRYGELGGGRMPYYHRFDLSASKKVVLGKYSYLDLTASITNVYNRKNIFYVNRVTNKRVNQLPILPSVGAKLTF